MKINYGDHFKQYNKFIIKNIDSPQLKLLIGQLNTQIFLTHQQDQQTSTTDEQEGGDKDDFSHAFQEQVTISLSMSGPLYPKLSMCFEGTRLTQLVQLVTAGRLFLGHKGQANLYLDECLYHCVCFGHKAFLLQVSLQVAAMA